MTMQNVAMGLLVGGKSRRMGTDKAMLPYAGRPAWERMSEMLCECGRVYLSAGSSDECFKKSRFPVVTDCFADIGPLGGLCSLLSAISEDAVFLCACDMPQMTADFVRYLEHRLSLHPECDGVCVADSLGRLYPTAAIYKKSCLPAALQAAENGNYRMRAPIDAGNFLFVSEEELPTDLRSCLLNINTDSAYRAYRDAENHTKEGRCEK